MRLSFPELLEHRTKNPAGETQGFLQKVPPRPEIALSVIRVLDRGITAVILGEFFIQCRLN